MMSRGFFPYTKHTLRETDCHAVLESLKSPFITQGPTVRELESKLEDFLGAKHCILVSNGTAALHLAVAAFSIPKNCKVITSPISFVATSNSALYNGLEPIFVDIEEDTANICIDDIVAAYHKDVKMVLPIHMTGAPVDMAKLKSNLPDDVYILEDACHAFGSQYKCGSMVGSCKYSDMAVFSFHPAKNLTTGEGGLICTNDDSLAKKVRLLRSHGVTRESLSSKSHGPWYYEMQELGFNYRLTDFQAALGLSQLNNFSHVIEKKQKLAAQYEQYFSDTKQVKTLSVNSYKDLCLHLFVLKIDFDQLKVSKSDFLNELKDAGVGTQVHYIPIYKQPYYREHVRESFEGRNFDNAEKYYQQAVSIPFYYDLSFDDQKYVAETINNLIEKYGM